MKRKPNGSKPNAFRTDTPAKNRTPRSSASTGKKLKKVDISWVNPDATGSNLSKYRKAVRTVKETSETRQDVIDSFAMIKKLAKKYGQDPTKDLEKQMRQVKKYRPDVFKNVKRSGPPNLMK